MESKEIQRGAIVDIIPGNPQYSHLGVVTRLGPVIEINRTPLPPLRVGLEDFFRERGRMRIEVADLQGEILSPTEIEAYNRAVITDSIS